MVSDTRSDFVAACDLLWAHVRMGHLSLYGRIFGVMLSVMPFFVNREHDLSSRLTSWSVELV